jgi:hypothetical protein
MPLQCKYFLIAASQSMDDTALSSVLLVLGCKNGGNNCPTSLRLVGKSNDKPYAFCGSSNICAKLCFFSST